MRSSAAIAALLLLVAGTACAKERLDKEPVDYVDPNIGGIGQLLTATSPYVQYPHGMVRLAPITTPGITDRYLADKIYGFPVGQGLIMMSAGAAGPRRVSYASDFDHDFETATPYYYAVELQTWDIRSEMTVTPEAGYLRFTTHRSGITHLEISLGRAAQFGIVGDHAIEGSQQIDGPIREVVATAGETREYFYLEVSQPFQAAKTWNGDKLSSEGVEAGDQIGFVSDYSMTGSTRLEVRFGISFISAEQARRNLEREIPRWNFEQTKGAARVAWNDALRAISISGASERQRTIFYTALYRSLIRMTDITEDGRYFSAYDHEVHDAKGHDFYVDDGTWDTFRSLHPLQLLLNAHQQEDVICSYLRMYEQSGWLPSFPSVAGDQAVMIGHHANQLILDAYMKGYRDFDLEEAFEGMKKNALQLTKRPWTQGLATDVDQVYFEKGFYPALAKGELEVDPSAERRQAVSVTLESAYDDWCVAQIARILGHQQDAHTFERFAGNYANLYNSGIGFMAPKSANGRWVADFDPELGGGQGGRDYFTEMNAWVYTFNVQHDVAGLIHLMGGRDAFNAKLDRLFVEQYGTSKFAFLGQFPDATGLVGQYAQGNEPSFHVPYLYDFSGQPWKTQFRVRQLMDVWYGDGPLGLAGDDDGGALSSWYVLSALGFYPVCPGFPVYEIGSPLFDRAAIRMGNGRVFRVIAHNVSAQNKYIQSATLNGVALDRPWFAHSDIANGGTLRLEMGATPNRSWGASVGDAPPSMTAVE